MKEVTDGSLRIESRGIGLTVNESSGGIIYLKKVNLRVECQTKTLCVYFFSYVTGKTETRNGVVTFL